MSSTMLVHIPVDYFTIVKGPSNEKWSQAMKAVSRGRSARLRFTLTTPASTETFERSIDAKWVDIYKDGSCAFNAFFGGIWVEGEFNLFTRDEEKGFIKPLTEKES